MASARRSQAFLHHSGKDPKAQLALLRKMERQWPFFRTLLSNMDMVLAKSDLALASRYAELVQDAGCAKRCLLPSRPNGTARRRRSHSSPGDKQRLADNSALARSIKHRFPYIDPLHHLQVELVRRWRAGQGDERVQTGIHIHQRDQR
jgi:phosphoenolpyruvate carboxylase